jgi:hypothetical protein
MKGALLQEDLDTFRPLLDWLDKRAGSLVPIDDAAPNEAAPNGAAPNGAAPDAGATPGGSTPADGVAAVSASSSFSVVS